MARKNRKVQTLPPDLNRPSRPPTGGSNKGTPSRPTPVAPYGKQKRRKSIP